MATETVTKYASTPGQTFTATFDATPITSSPVPSVAFYSDVNRTALVSGPTDLTQVTANVWSVPVPNLAAQTLYIKYSFKTEVGGTLLTDSSDTLVLAVAGVGSGSTLCTLAEVKAQLGKTSVTEDAQLTTWIGSVTAIIEGICGPMVSRTVTDAPAYPSGSALSVKVRPVLSITSVTEYTGSTAQTYTVITSPASAGAYTVMLENNRLIRRLDESGRRSFTGGVVVVYQAGRSPIPDAINRAAIIIVQHLWRTRNGGAGLPQLLDEPVEYDQGFGYAIPNRALDLIQPYRQGLRLG